MHLYQIALALMCARQGSLEARNHLIKEHMACAAAEARMRGRDKDIYGNALLAVVEATDRYIRELNWRANRFSMYVRGAAALGACDPVRDHARFKTRTKKKVKAIKREHARTRRQRNHVTLTSTVTISEVTEEVMLLTNDDREQHIIKLKLAGYSNKEVAAKIGVDPSTVGRALEALEVRWQRRMVTEKMIECGIPNT